MKHSAWKQGYNMRNTYRSDDKPEVRIYFSTCAVCYWEDIKSYGSEEECNLEECPDCGSDVEIMSDFV